jgi:transcriptional regulator with XRE-family HTH domain
MTPSELIGRQMAAARRDQRLTQQQLGERLAPWLGQPWKKQAVAAAEGGDRAFTAAELLALAACLEVPLGYFFSVPPGTEEENVEFPGGLTVPLVTVLGKIVYSLDTTGALPEQSQMMMLRIAGDLVSTQQKEVELHLHAERGAALLVQLAQGLPVVRQAVRHLEPTTEKKRPQRRPRKGGGGDAAK